MPLLPLLGGLFTTLASFFTAWVSKKVAMAAAVVSVSFGMFMAFVGAIWAIFQSVTLVTPSWMVGGIGLFLPDNTEVCLAALMTAKLARAGYEYQKETLRLVSYVT